jgi:hypothetical protein
MRSTFFIITIVFIGFLQCEYVSSYRSKTNIPSIMDTEASQWLSSGRIPRRWRQQKLINKPSDEFIRTLEQLQRINENGIYQYDVQSYTGVEFEVLNEYRRRGK